VPLALVQYQFRVHQTAIDMPLLACRSTVWAGDRTQPRGKTADWGLPCSESAPAPGCDYHLDLIQIFVHD
jgi:hypothetical protein